MNFTIFTIGHSTHSSDEFMEILERYHVNAICDVRSSPYSKFNPQFNKEKLKADLESSGLRYVFLGKELGARSDDPRCYQNGKVQYDLLAKTALFREGLDRVKKGSKDFAIALMCAEKDPIDCHRTILVARELEKEGLQVMHILSDGKAESHQQSIQRLRDKLRLGHGDLFMDDGEILDQAYRIQGNAIGYVRIEEKDRQEEEVIFE